MGKTCDVCGKELGFFKKFRYAEGYICKECYAKASRHFTETITSKSLSEIKVLCSVQRDEASFENFKVTGKIGNYLLVDENHGRLCIPCNRLTNQKVTEPIFIDVAQIKECYIGYHPHMELSALEQLVKEQRSEDTIHQLKVGIVLEDGREESITLVQKPLRIKSFAFRQSFQFSKRIYQEIDRLMTGKKEQNSDDADDGESDYAAV